MWEGFLGAILGAAIGAIIPSLISWKQFTVEREDNMQEIKAGVSREADKKIAEANIKSNERINAIEVAFNEKAQEENKAINEKLNELIEQQNYQKNQNDQISILIEYFRTKQTDKWEQKKIDANLKAAARIEWIQEVRKLVSSLIEDINNLDPEWYLTADQMIEYIASSKKNITLIQLHFGPDKEHSIDVMSLETNKGKNELIIDKLNDLDKKIDDIVNNIRFESQNSGLDVMSRHKMENFCTTNYSDTIVNDVKELKEIFRIYFKVEWDRAKEGK